MTMRKKVGVLVAGLAALGLSPLAFAQGVGNLGDLPSGIPQAGPTGWLIGNPSAPIPVVRDPAGPKWIKLLTDPNGGPIVNPNPGTIYNLNETVLISGNLWWSDWHEEIITPGWEWTSTVVILENVLNPPAGLNIVNTPGSPTQGGTLVFYFDPLPPGTVLHIRKQLEYVGIAGTVHFGAVEVAQYPTPEPATMGLLAAGGLLALRRRRLRAR